MQVTVECQLRPNGQNPNALRRQGLIPAVLYGHQGAESVSLTLNAKTAQNLLKTASVNNTLVDVNIPELPWNGKALIREVQAHPWRRTLYHLSFFSIAAQKSVEVVVPLRLTGSAVGVRQGGILEQMMIELKIQCPPDKIPDAIDIDISNFKIGSSLQVNELVLPEDVMNSDDPARGVFKIIAPKKGALAEEDESPEDVVAS